MVRTKYFSVYSDFKSSLFAKIFFILAIIFLVVFVILSIFNIAFPADSDGLIGEIVTVANSSFTETCLALFILLFGLALISLFFHHQFKKLASIADEIEELEKCEK